MPSYTEVIEWLINPEISRTVILCFIGYLFLLWIALIIWVTKDIIGRTNSIVFQIISIFLVVFLNIFGILIYLAIRPSKTLIENFFEDLEYEALVQETKETHTHSKEKRKQSKIKVKSKAKSKRNKS
jgi:uncharacterized protein YacL